MGLSSGLALFVIGAILAFAVELDVAGLNINLVGYILMVAGIAGILLDVAYFAPRRRRSTVVEERREAL